MATVAGSARKLVGKGSHCLQLAKGRRRSEIRVARHPKEGRGRNPNEGAAGWRMKCRYFPEWFRSNPLAIIFHDIEGAGFKQFNARPHPGPNLGMAPLHRVGLYPHDPRPACGHPLPFPQARDAGRGRNAPSAQAKWALRVQGDLGTCCREDFHSTENSEEPI